MSLEELLRIENALTNEEVKVLMIDCAEGLVHMNFIANLLHNDIKP